MIPHRYRLLALILFALAEVALIVLPSLGVISSETAVQIGTVIAGLAAALGLADAGMVERRRRDPSVAALSDDVRHADDATLAQALDDARGER